MDYKNSIFIKKRTTNKDIELYIKSPIRYLKSLYYFYCKRNLNKMSFSEFKKFTDVKAGYVGDDFIKNVYTIVLYY